MYPPPPIQDNLIYYTLCNTLSDTIAESKHHSMTTSQLTLFTKICDAIRAHEGWMERSVAVAMGREQNMTVAHVSEMIDKCVMQGKGRDRTDRGMYYAALAC